MSIIYCHDCDTHYDSDFETECAGCEDEPIKLYPETTPSWLSDPVQAVPTLDDLKAAVAETYEAFERFNADREAGRDTTESHASYMGAIERQCDLNNQRFVAALKEAPVCPSI